MITLSIIYILTQITGALVLLLEIIHKGELYGCQMARKFIRHS